MKRFYIQTFGCQMNVYDSNTVRQLLVDRGFVETEKPDQAEVVLVNTCTVREKADVKAIEYIRSMKRRGKKVLVMGCMAQWMREQLLNVGADWVVGTGSLVKIPRLLLGEEQPGVYCENVGEFPKEQQVQEGSPFAFLTIMRGCDHFCTFCIVPRVRGREISRPHPEILEEARRLEEKGVLELTLLGQNVNSYFDGTLDFAELLSLLDRETRFLRIRFTSPHPRDMTAKVVRTIAESQRITDWIHLPLQAGSTRVLLRMHRGYTKEEFIEKARMIRRLLPEGTLTTDIMVGFPGETEQDFEDTLDVVRAVEFDGAYMFIYSPRPGTAAARFPDQVPDAIKGARLRKLIEVVNEGIARRRQQMIGRVYDVLIEKPARKSRGYSAGKTRGNVTAIVEGTYPPGTWVRGKVREIRGLTPVITPLRVIPYPEVVAQIRASARVEAVASMG